MPTRGSIRKLMISSIKIVESLYGPCRAFCIVERPGKEVYRPYVYENAVVRPDTGTWRVRGALPTQSTPGPAKAWGGPHRVLVLKRMLFGPRTAGSASQLPNSNPFRISQRVFAFSSRAVEPDIEVNRFVACRFVATVAFIANSLVLLYFQKRLSFCS